MFLSHNQYMQRASGVVVVDDDDVAAAATLAIVIFKIISICIDSNNMLVVMWLRWCVRHEFILCVCLCVCASNIMYAKRDVCCEALKKMAKQYK